MFDITEKKRINNVITSIEFVLDYVTFDKNVSSSDSDNKQDFSDSEFSDKKESGLKILTPNQMLSRSPITLAHLKAGNNSEKLKNKIWQLLYSLYISKKLTKQQFGWHYSKMENMNTENSKTSEPHRFKLDLTDKLNLKNPNKNMALVNLSIYYTWNNIKSKYKNNKFISSAPTWNDTFDLPDGSYSVADIQDYFEFIIKKHETLKENPRIQIYPKKKLKIELLLN